MSEGVYVVVTYHGPELPDGLDVRGGELGDQAAADIDT